ncbi:hypothetical protein ATZ36_14070 [Candidatus Endomicrobiellum trichonymphae]|uniref:Uncharacterized protein n=1 Tax=Endomicrobium trichonymphae TaxID=1408204 RepID=A0A1E5IM41_ENDTX|nr:hypothetical protein ATZ36_14070 [Candidatus Endomicrobium trichonymphae]
MDRALYSAIQKMSCLRSKRYERWIEVSRKTKKRVPINLNKTELIVVRNTVIELQSAMKTIALNSSLKVSY